MRKDCHIWHIEQYLIFEDRVLGQGATGCVYEGLHIRSSRKVAVKVIDLNSIDNQVSQYLLEMQKIALQRTSCTSNLHAQKILVAKNKCYIVTNLLTGGTLKKHIQTSPGGHLEQKEALRLFQQILIGYAELVDKGILHRDLKPTNIMLHEGAPVIIDFGYCEVQGYCKPKLEYNVGSPSYMAPQSFRANVYNEKTEMWALGMLLHQCLVGRTIDRGRHMGKVYEQMKIRGIFYPSHVSSHARAIISQCLSLNPDRRPTCAQLFEACFTNAQNQPPTKEMPFSNSRPKVHSLQAKAYKHSKIEPVKESTLQFAEKAKRVRPSKGKQQKRIRASLSTRSILNDYQLGGMLRSSAKLFCNSSKLGVATGLLRSPGATSRQNSRNPGGKQCDNQYFADYEQQPKGLMAYPTKHYRLSQGDPYDYLRA